MRKSSEATKGEIRPARTNARNVVLRFASRGLASAFQAVSLLLVARLIGPSDFGVFSFTLALGYLLGALLGFGATTRVLRISAEQNPEQLGSSLFGLRAAGALVSVAIGVFVSLHSAAPTVGLAAAAMAGSDQFVDFSQARLTGMGKQVTASLMVLAQRLLPLISFLVLFLVRSPQIIWVLISSLVLLAWAAAGPLTSFKVDRNYSEVIPRSTGYWASSVVSNINQLEPIVLKVVTTNEIVGKYSLASRITGPLTIFVSAMQMVLIPDLASSIGQPRFFLVFRRFLWASVAYAVVLVACSPLIVLAVIWVMGNRYSGLQSLLYAMVFAAALSAISQTYQARLVAEGRPWRPTLVIAAGSVASLIFLVTIPLIIGTKYLWICAPLVELLILGGMLAVVQNKNKPDAPITFKRKLKQRDES